MASSPFFLTTAIDYANGKPHLGTAYEKITADVIARYKRLCGIETHFLMGLDEHSLNVYRKAREQGLDPLVYCDQMAAIFRDVWGRLDISFDDFIRTTEPRHRVAVQAMTEKIRANGDLYEGLYEGWYCESCEAFKPEKDLVDGLCPIHRTKPAWISETNHFFRLSAYRDRLLAHFAAHPEFLQPDVRRNEILRLLEAGLEDISISRAGQPWGIPVPYDPKSVVYVWFDALINYITAVGYGADPDRLAKWWPANLHVVGKDITRFHAVVWPAMLMAAGEALPRQVFGHGWVHFKGEKMSKSLGTAVDPLEAVERLGADPLRLYLVKEVPYGARRRLLVGTLRGALQRRPGQQPRQPGEPHRQHGRALRRRARRADRRTGTAGGRGRRDAGGVSRGDGRLRAARRRQRRLPAARRGQRVHRADAAVGAGEGSGGRRPARPGAVRRGRDGARRGRAAAAGHARLGS